MLRLVIASNVADRHQKNGTVYLPDFIIFDFDEEDYKAFWRELATHPREQLYTDGINVVRVGRARHALESIKGRMSAENHCQRNRVDMTLAKIAYMGYLSGFSSTELQQLDPPPISLRFRTLINSPKTNEVTAELQQILMNYFVTYLRVFPVLNQSINTTYPFGQTFVSAHLAYLQPIIDPQDSQTIAAAIVQINRFRQTPQKSASFKSSPFAEAYALSLVEQLRFTEALEWSSQVETTCRESFISFYLTMEHYDAQAATKAMKLIASLASSPRTEDQAAAVAYVQTRFNFTGQLNHLKTHDDLRQKVAKAYLNDAKTEKSKGLQSNPFTDNQTIKFLAQAVNLDPKVLEDDDSMHEIMMSDQLTLYQFDNAIDEKRFQEAEVLYDKYPHLTFNKNKLEILREYCFSQFSANEGQLREAVTKKNTSTAEKIASEQIALAEKIDRLRPQGHLVMAATLSYASTLLAIDVIKHPAVKDADLEQLIRVQTLLNKLTFLNGTTPLLEVHNKLLLRKIDSLIAKLNVPITYIDDRESRIAFVKEHQHELYQLKKDLRAFISLNEKKSKEMRHTLAKMHYLLADTLFFFEEKKQEAITHFEKATELMPENLYYKLHYFVIIEGEQRLLVRQTIKNRGLMDKTKPGESFCGEVNIHVIPSEDLPTSNVFR